MSASVFTFASMNTGFLLSGLPEPVCAQVQEFICRAETYFSRFNQNSLINRINRNKGQWVPVNSITFDLLKDALDAYRITEGLFNPFLGAVMHKFGYDQSFENLQAVVGPRTTYRQDDRCLRALPTQQNDLPIRLDFDHVRYRVRLSSASNLDLGGIGKGWIAQNAYVYCTANGVNRGLIDAGGDIVLWGNALKQELWGVGVAHPFEPDKDIADLWLNGIAAIATSSTMKRQWATLDQGCAHHIIDPRTLSPADSDLLQVTILARNLVIAEQYTKCLLILGEEAGFPWIEEKRPDLAYIVVRKDGRVLTSKNLRSYCSEREVRSYI